MRLLILWLTYLLRQKSSSSYSLFIAFFSISRAFLILKVELHYILYLRWSNLLCKVRRTYYDFLLLGYIRGIHHRNFIWNLVCTENIFLRIHDTFRTNNVCIFISLDNLTSCFVKLHFFKDSRWYKIQDICPELFLLKSIWWGICS